MGNHENCGKSAGETVQMKCIQYEIEKLLSDTLPSPPLPSYPWPCSARHLLFLPASRSKINMYLLSDIFYAFDNCHFRAQSTETTNTRNQIRNRISSLESEILESRS